MKLLRHFSTAGLFLLLFACATSPLGRKQLMLVSDSQMDQMGIQAFDQIKTTQKIEKDPATVQYVNCIVKPLTDAARDQTNVPSWDVVVFKSKEANAFALPGGKIGVYTGIIDVAKSPDQLAAVVGHEIGHVIARHGAERVSQQASTQLGLAVVGEMSGNSPHQRTLMGLLGMGAQVGILLPFSRTQESEADLIGLQLMAKSGFDPRQSSELWRNMIAHSEGKAPPQILSTHPASENRIAELEAHMGPALNEYRAAQAAGRAPHCSR